MARKKRRSTRRRRTLTPAQIRAGFGGKKRQAAAKGGRKRRTVRRKRRASTAAHTGAASVARKRRSTRRSVRRRSPRRSGGSRRSFLGVVDNKTLTGAALGIAGAVATAYAVAKVPGQFTDTPAKRMAATAGVGLLGALILKRTMGKPAATAFLTGTVTAAGVALVRSKMPQIPQAEVAGFFPVSQFTRPRLALAGIGQVGADPAYATGPNNMGAFVRAS